MVLWAWKPFGWRWLTHKQQDIPKYVTGTIVVAFLGHVASSARPELHQLNGFTDSYESRVAEIGNEILDDKKIVTLAVRRQKMLKDRAEAEEYFTKHGYQPRPTNQFMIISDNLGN